MADRSPASRWSITPGVVRGDDYDARWSRLAAAGHSVHGEADFVHGYRPRSVLDAGCGTGRVAIELARRGADVVGVDLDPAMLATARTKAPELVWVDADLTTVALERSFDAVVLAGNVMIFLRPGSERDVLANLAGHLSSTGVLVAGIQLGRAYGLDEFEADCVAVGLAAEGRFSTWEGAPWTASSDYVVSVHRRRSG